MAKPLDFKDFLAVDYMPGEDGIIKKAIGNIKNKIIELFKTKSTNESEKPASWFSWKGGRLNKKTKRNRKQNKKKSRLRRQNINRKNRRTSIRKRNNLKSSRR